MTVRSESATYGRTRHVPTLKPKRVKRVQQVLGKTLFCGRAVDNTILTHTSAITAEQAAATENSLAKTYQLLHYLASNPDACLHFWASDMIL